MLPRILSGSLLAEWFLDFSLDSLEELLDLIRPITAVATKSPDRGELARLRPARDRLGVYTKQRCDLGWREERVILLRLHNFPSDPVIELFDHDPVNPVVPYLRLLPDMSESSSRLKPVEMAT